MHEILLIIFSIFTMYFRCVIWPNTHHYYILYIVNTWQIILERAHRKQKNKSLRIIKMYIKNLKINQQNTRISFSPHHQDTTVELCKNRKLTSSYLPPYRYIVIRLHYKSIIRLMFIFMKLDKEYDRELHTVFHNGCNVM